MISCSRRCGSRDYVALSAVMLGRDHMHRPGTWQISRLASKHRANNELRHNDHASVARVGTYCRSTALGRRPERTTSNSVASPWPALTRHPVRGSSVSGASATTSATSCSRRCGRPPPPSWSCAGSSRPAA